MAFAAPIRLAWARRAMAIEIRQTKRAIVYRAVVSSGAPGSKKVSKTFRTKAAAQAWEREMLQAGGRAATPP
jgi:hypothetical protein